MNKRAKIGIWGAVPVMLYAEKGITKNEIVVYIAISSYWRKASLEEIAERAAISKTKASSNILKLVKRGWVGKTNNGKFITYISK